MKPEAQRIAIAEACGWKGPFVHYDSWSRVPVGLYADSPNFADQPVPDFLNDLNAMHEAELLLLPFESDAWQTYAGWLSHLTPLGGQDHATASERAMAFLKAIGKWVESDAHA